MYTYVMHGQGKGTVVVIIRLCLWKRLSPLAIYSAITKYWGVLKCVSCWVTEFARHLFMDILWQDMDVIVWMVFCSFVRYSYINNYNSNRPKNQKITQQVIPDTILLYWHQENVILSKNSTRLEPTSSRHCWVGHTWGL